MTTSPTRAADRPAWLAFTHWCRAAPRPTPEDVRARLQALAAAGNYFAHRLLAKYLPNGGPGAG